MTPRGDETSTDGPPATIEAYEDDGAVVLFDTNNPLAWVEATRAVSLSDNV